MPVANSRLRKLDNGRIELTLKRPMYDGMRSIALTGGQLIRRLPAIVPQPEAVKDHAARVDRRGARGLP